MADLGYNIQGATESHWTEYLTLYQVTPTEGGTITLMRLRTFKDYGGTANVRFAIYSDNAGAPGTLLAYTNTNTLVSGTLNWYSGNSFTEAVAGGLTFAANVPLWLGVMNDDPGTVKAYLGDGNANQLYLASPSYSPWNFPATITGFITRAPYVASLVAEYTPAGGAPDTTKGFFGFF